MQQPVTGQDSLSMRQAVIRGPKTFEVETVPRPALRSSGELLLRTAACGICSGDLMEWYLERKVNTVLGHEVVGYAAEVGPELEHVEQGQLMFVHHHAPCMECRFCRAGDPVHCPTWRGSKLDPGGMAEYIRVPVVNAHQDSFAIDDLTPEVGAIIEPLACSVKALARLGGRPREHGVVVGCGVMGLLNIAVAKAAGSAEVWAVEPDAGRREHARRFGADQVFTPWQLDDETRKQGFEGADYVIVGPGSPEVIVQSLGYVRNGGTVVLFTPTPAVPTALDFCDLYFREVSLVPSYSCGPQDTRRAYELLRTGAVDVSPLITHRFRIDEIQQAYNTAKSGGDVLKVLVVFGDGSP
ncbi:MAG: zinc-dependent dehydrogenase [Gammaproteobacteria bacterium]|nr:MAG: zinc-dependent dehydrogenase [Gammaproteobacteria bacterium]